MGPHVDCCYGEFMTAVDVLHSPSNLAGAERSVTILGATGSIGASTIDLIRRAPTRYRVEAVSAYRNAAALAKIARELGARFAAVGDPDCYGKLKEALAGSGVEAGAGEAAVVE